MKSLVILCIISFANCLNAQVTPIINENNFKYTNPNSLHIHNNLIIFSAEDIYGREPWVTDGTNSGTKTLGNIDGSNTSSNPSFFAKYANKTFFVAYSNSAYRLWETDGTLTGTKLFMNLNDSGASPMMTVAFNRSDSFFSFLAITDSFGLQLWVSDGTEAGTKAITKIYNTNSAFVLGKIDDEYYFTYEDSVYGKEVFKTKGIEYEHKLVKDIYPGKTSSFPGVVVQFNHKILFIADNGINGRELWTTDGSNVGTTLLNDIYPGSGYPNFTSRFIKDNNKYYFSVKIGSNISVWQTDGSISGTSQFLKPIDCENIRSIYMFQNTIFASAQGKGIGNELFIQSNDSLIFFRDFNFGSNSSYIENFTTVNDTLLFFTALNSINSSDVWVMSKSKFKPQLFLRLPFTGDIRNIIYLNNTMYFSIIKFDSGEFTLYRLDSKVVGLKPINIEKIDIFPNPATNRLNINSWHQISKVTIFNQLGQTVIKEQYNMNNIELDITILTTGVYTVKIDTNNGQTQFEKFIKN